MASEELPFYCVDTPNCKAVVHLMDVCCKSHRSQVRSGYSAEALAAAHHFVDCYPTVVTLHGLNIGPLNT
eukprot:7643597-Pyramimonas_sp.AAC.1